MTDQMWLYEYQPARQDVRPWPLRGDTILVLWRVLLQQINQLRVNNPDFTEETIISKTESKTDIFDGLLALLLKVM